MDSASMGNVTSIEFIKPIYSKLSDEYDIRFHVMPIVGSKFPRSTALVKISYETLETTYAIITPISFSEYSCHILKSDINVNEISTPDTCI